MSPVAYDHLSVPSRATRTPGCPATRPARTRRPAMAGEDMMGPPVGKIHQIGRLDWRGARTASGPRWVAPNRNIAWAGSTAYCGSGSDVDDPALTLPGGREAAAGQTQRPASHSRLSLQSWSAGAGHRLHVGAGKRRETETSEAEKAKGRAKADRQETKRSDGARLRQIEKPARPSVTIAELLGDISLAVAARSSAALTAWLQETRGPGCAPPASGAASPRSPNGPPRRRPPPPRP